MECAEDMRGITIGRHNINIIRYTDDTALIATYEQVVQNLVDDVAHSYQLGLKLKCKNT